MVRRKRFVVRMASLGNASISDAGLSRNSRRYFQFHGGCDAADGHVRVATREGAALMLCSLPTWWRWVANGTFRPAVELGGMSRWPQSEILVVIEKAKAARTVA